MTIQEGHGNIKGRLIISDLDRVFGYITIEKIGTTRDKLDIGEIFLCKERSLN